MNTFIIITIILNLSLVSCAVFAAYAFNKLSEPELSKLKELASNFWNKHLTNNTQRVLVVLAAPVLMYLVAALNLVLIPFNIIKLGVNKCH